MPDALIQKYDIYYINPSSQKMGFMLAKDRTKVTLWQRNDERALPDNYPSGDISYANLSPDVQKSIAHELFHGGIGASYFEVADDAAFNLLRSLRTQNVDTRCKGKVYLGPKQVVLTVPDGAGAIQTFTDFDEEQFMAMGTLLTKLNAAHTGYEAVKNQDNAPLTFPHTITDICASQVDGMNRLWVAQGDTQKLWYYSRPVIDLCEIVWSEYVYAQVTASLDTTDKIEGDSSLKLVVAEGAAAGQFLATQAIPSTDMTTYYSVDFWIKSSVALNSGDLQYWLSQNARCATPNPSLNIPAVSANTWTKVRLPFGGFGSIVIISEGIKMVVDKGAFTLRIDQIRSEALAKHATEATYHLSQIPNKLRGIKQAGGNLLRESATPTGDWANASAQYAGTSTYKHQDLVNVGNVTWIVKEEGAFYLDASGNIINPFPELISQASSRSGLNSQMFNNRLYFTMGALREWEIDGSVLTEVTPCSFAPDVSQYNYPCVARASDGIWLYALMKRATNDYAVLAGRWEYIAGMTRWVWHDPSRITSLTDINVATVSSHEGRPFLYLGSTIASEGVVKVYLPTGDDATADSDYRFNQTGTFWSPGYRTLLFAISKRWQSLQGCGWWAGTKYIKPFYSLDFGATFVAFPADFKFTTPPTQTIAFPSGIEATQCHLKLDFVSDVDTVSPVLYTYILNAIVLMPAVVRFRHTVKCADNLLLKKNLQSNTTVSAIAAFINTIRDKVCTLGDRDGNEHTVKVTVAQDYEAIDLESRRPIHLYDIETIKI